MARTPNHYAIHLLLAGGHHQVINFADLASFQKWYGDVLNAGPAEAFVNVPINDLQGEYLVVRPSGVVGIRVEPQFTSFDE
jgi:hypothetical protein